MHVLSPTRGGGWRRPGGGSWQWIFVDETEQISQPSYTVEETAIHLYTLRNKLAHGVDLRRAASDPKFPVDLSEKHMIRRSSEPVPYAVILSEAACYLLCQILKKEIAAIARLSPPEIKS